MEEMEGLKICLNCLWFSPRIKKGEQIYLEICEKRYGSSWKITQLQKFHFQKGSENNDRYATGSKKGQGLLEKKGVVLFLKEYIPQFFNSF